LLLFLSSTDQTRKQEVHTSGKDLNKNKVKSKFNRKKQKEKNFINDEASKEEQEQQGHFGARRKLMLKILRPWHVKRKPRPKQSISVSSV